MAVRKSIFILLILILMYKSGGGYMAGAADFKAEKHSNILSSKSFSLDERYASEATNNVFKANILLTLNYLTGNVKSKSDIIWSEIEKPGVYQFNLNPGESFAFHDQVLPDFQNSVVKTTNAHFNYQDGFKSSGYLFGDGVCHLASLINWASLEAGLASHTPTSHNFANINEVPKEYGVSIYYLPNGFAKSSRENLYITNNLGVPVSFVFSYNGKDLSLEIKKS